LLPFMATYARHTHQFKAFVAFARRAAYHHTCTGFVLVVLLRPSRLRSPPCSIMSQITITTHALAGRHLLLFLPASQLAPLLPLLRRGHTQHNRPPTLQLPQHQTLAIHNAPHRTAPHPFPPVSGSRRRRGGRGRLGGGDVDHVPDAVGDLEGGLLGAVQAEFPHLVASRQRHDWREWVGGLVDEGEGVR
jgi:hypothetical protein